MAQGLLLLLRSACTSGIKPLKKINATAVFRFFFNDNTLPLIGIAECIDSLETGQEVIQMLKRWIMPLQKWLFGVTDNQHRTRLDSSDEPDTTRRRFFKQAAISTVSVAGTAGLAKTIVDSMPQPDLRQQYNQDAVKGENELLQREYVVMTDEEKDTMVQSLVDTYNKES
ncbi:MAG: hypothetical protein KME67_11885 [Candidatus Thiodiazotropha sp. (ex Codakia orbicularis)]|nr:hypothetical protein [Candidatus Thiodiazotropha sp. (ex Codakia orbicularis)]